MSVNDYAADCQICKDFINYDFSIYDIQTRCKKMAEMTQQHTMHLRLSHKPKKTFAFTLTTNKQGKEVENEMVFATHRIYMQNTTPIEEGAAYLEYTEEGRPHIHGWYKTEDGGRVFSKTFKRCWPTWGEKRGHTKFAGGFHEEMKSDRYKDYAAAEDRVICVKKKDELLILNAPPQADPPPQIAQDDPPSPNGNGT